MNGRDAYVLGPGPGYRPPGADPDPPQQRGRWTDRDGHSWPITGRHCHTCGRPLHRLLVAAGATTHWLCRTQGTPQHDPKGPRT